MTGAKTAVPLWRKISHTLAAEIGDQGLQPGSRLPTEAELATRFEVNRHTVRRAIDALVRSGLVRVEQGRGSFVAEDMLDYTVQRRTRFSEWVRKQNKEPSGQVLQLRELASHRVAAAALGIDPSSPVVFYERIGLADGIPISLTSHYFPAAKFPGLLQALRGGPTITAALASIGVSDYERQITRVSARMPTANEASSLKVSRARPLLVCDNINVDQQRTPVEFGIARYPSTKVQVVFEP